VRIGSKKSNTALSAQKGNTMRVLLLTIACTVLSACATSPNPSVDEKYMARVERGAQLGNAQIVWVNPPTEQPHVEAPAAPQVQQ
jgi:hypothetical protein